LVKYDLIFFVKKEDGVTLHPQAFAVQFGRKTLMARSFLIVWNVKRGTDSTYIAEISLSLQGLF